MFRLSSFPQKPSGRAAKTRPQTFRGGVNSRRGRCAGFTLSEAIVATVIFTMTMMGVYACVIKAYQLSQITRYNDQARSILLSYVDQFERLKTVQNGYVRPFFTPAQTTGIGLNWPGLSNDPAVPGAVVTAADGLPKEIMLGDGTTTASIKAYVTRAVYPMDAATGTLLPTTTAQTVYIKAPGCMLMGIFTISYTMPSGKTYSQRLTVVRTVTS